MDKSGHEEIGGLRFICGTAGLDGTTKRGSSEKMAGRWHVPDVNGFHHERMERDA